MHHLRGNAIPADHVQNLLTNSYEILCRCSLKQNFDIMGIEMWAKLAQNCKNLIYFVKICSLGTNLLERFFYKIREESQFRPLAPNFIIVVLEMSA